MKESLFSAVLVGALALGGVFLGLKYAPAVEVTVQPSDVNLGASTFRTEIQQATRITTGDDDGTIGTATVVAGASTSTLTAAQLCNNSVVSITLFQAPGIVTLPSGGNMSQSCLDRYLSEGNVTLYNGSSTAFAVVAGASSTLDLENISGATTTLPAFGYARLKFTRVSTSTGDRLRVVYQYNP